MAAPEVPPEVAVDATAGWWTRTAGGLPRPFWYVWTGTIVNRLGQFVEPFLALYLVQARGVSLTTTGLVLAGFGLGAFASQPLGGWLADRYGRRFTMVLGLTSSAAALTLLGVARPLWLIAVAAALYGLVVDMYRPAVAAVVADLVDPKDRVRAYALVYWAVNLGVSFSGLLGGVLALHGWWLLFALDAITCLGMAILIARGVPETRPERDEHDSGGYSEAVRDRLLLALTALTLVGATVYLQAYITLPLAMREDGLSPAAYGVAYAVNPIVVILVQPFTMRALTTLPRMRVYSDVARAARPRLRPHRPGARALGLCVDGPGLDPGGDRVQRGGTEHRGGHRAAGPARSLQRDDRPRLWRRDLRRAPHRDPCARGGSMGALGWVCPRLLGCGGGGDGSGARVAPQGAGCAR